MSEDKDRQHTVEETSDRVLVLDDADILELNHSPADEVGRATMEERVFYQREARVLAERQPERAALMWLEAAVAAERAGAGQESILADVEAAIELRPDSAWLLSLARRLLVRQRSYDRALEICEREVELGGENAARVAVLQEAAALVRHHKSDAAGALALLDRALTIQPGCVPALFGAIALRTELERHAEAAEGLERLSATITTAEERTLYLFAAGTLREARLDQPEAAEASYRRALEADGQNLPVLMALCTLYERRDMWSQLCQCLEHRAQLAPTPAIEARLLYQAGSLHLDRTGDLDSASRDLSLAAQAAPQDPWCLQRLADVYEAEGRAGELVATLQELLELTLDSQRRAALLAHIGWLLQTRLGEGQQATQSYRRALEAMPGYLPALQSLGTLYRNQGDHESLLEIYAPEVEGTLPARARAIRCIEMGEILGSRLNRPDQAVRHYRRALELDPGQHLAFWRLRRLLKQLGQYEELADLLVTQTEQSQDENTRTHLMLEVARLAAGPLGELERAISILESIPEADRTRSIASDLLELYERSGRFAEMVSLLLAQADDTEDAAEAQGRRLQAAAVLEFFLEETDRALELNRQILQEDPQCVAAVRGAGRIYHRLGRWNELIELNYHELQVNPDRPDAAMLLCRVGRIHENSLGQTAEAIEAYSRALEKDASCVPALAALEQLVRAERRWEDLIEVLQRYAAARMDRLAVADALCRAAEVADCQLGDLERAVELYRQALGQHPRSLAARHGLLRVYKRQQSWPEAAQVLRELIEANEPDEERSHLQLELALLREFRLNEPPDLELYRAAAEGSPIGSRLRAELTRILHLTRSPQLADWLQRLGEQIIDPALAAAHLLESAHLRELCDEVSGSSLEAARQAHVRQPDDLAVIWCLEGALWEGRCWAELGQLREKDAQLEPSPTVRAARLSSAAVAFLQAGQAEEAARVARECLDLDANGLVALGVLARLAEAQGSWSEFAVLCDRLAAACTDATNRLEWCVRAADLWADRAGESSRALASLGVILSDHPGQPMAFARAEHLLWSARQFEELSRLYRRWIQACKQPVDRIDPLRSHARLLRDDLHDHGRALAELSDLLAIAPSDVEALRDLSELLIAQGHWSDAASRLSKLIEVAADVEVRHRARLRQAELWIRHLHEPRRAREVLRAALQEQPTDLEARRLMVDLARTEGSWEEARQILEEIAAVQDLQVQVWAMLQLSDVARLGLRDETLREQCVRDALALASTDPGALSMLVEQYRTRREQAQLVTAAEQYLSSCAPTADTTRLRVAIARLLLDDVNQPEQALKHLLQCLKTDPEDEPVRLLIGRAMEGQGRTSMAAMEYRTLLERNAGCVEAYRGLGRVSGNPETARAAASLVDLLGQATPEETVLLQGVEGTAMPAGRLDLGIMSPPEELRPLRQVLQLAAPYLGPVYPTSLPDRLAEDHRGAIACQRLAASLGMGKVLVSLTGPAGATAGLGEPVPLVLAPALATSPGSAAFRFWVGRALCTAATGSVLLEQLRDDELVELVEALCSPRLISQETRQLRKQVGKMMPRKVRKQLEEMDVSVDPRAWAACRAWEQQRADQVGLLMSRSPTSAIAELARALNVPGDQVSRSPRLARLMRFAISDDYARGCHALWT